MGAVSLRPHEILTRRFAPKLFGVDRGEVRRALLEVAVAFNRKREELAHHGLERAALQKMLAESTHTIADLKRQLDVVEEMLSAYQGHAGRLVHTVREAERSSARLTEAFRTWAGDMSEGVRKVADETVRVAQQAGAQTLADAGVLADRALRAAERVAAICRELPRVDQAWLTAQTHRRLAEISRTPGPQTEMFSARVEALYRQREEALRRIHAVAEDHAEALDGVLRAQRETQVELVALLHFLWTQLGCHGDASVPGASDQEQPGDPKAGDANPPADPGAL